MADAFGTGDNQFSVDFVTIGNPGNQADTTGWPDPVGSVSYEYRIGKYEISRDMIEKANMSGGLGITLADMAAIGGNGPNRPATGLTGFEAFRFVNWLNTSNGFPAAYRFTTRVGDVDYQPNEQVIRWEPEDVGYDASNPWRNSHAYYFVPNMDEWYKAAYYDPNANNGNGGYWDYPTESDSAPIAVTSGTDAGTAVWSQLGVQGPTDIMLAGGLSPYGTMAQGGNVWEWDDVANSQYTSGVRGGDWGYGKLGHYLSGQNRRDFNWATESESIGLRIASVPEPTSTWGLILATTILWPRSKKTG